MAELRGKSDQSFADMSDWLGARYLREMAAVDGLTNYGRQHIEDGLKLNVELKLEQDVRLFLLKHGFYCKILKPHYDIAYRTCCGYDIF